MNKLHPKSLLSAHNNEPQNPHIWSSANWLAWEAIDRLKQQGQIVVDAWLTRGFSVKVKTPNSENIIKVL